MGEKIKQAIGIEGTFKETVWPMIQYCFANIFMGGGGYIISMYFTIFLTNVVGMELRHATFIMMIATVWDGINDPIMGLITDRTRSKYGRHRRYILWAMPLYAVSFALLWNSYGLNGRDELTQKEVADILGISQSYISRLEKKIMQRLKKKIEEKQPKKPKTEKKQAPKATKKAKTKKPPVNKAPHTPKGKKNNVKVIFLGGVDGIGMNCTAFEYDGHPGGCAARRRPVYEDLLRRYFLYHGV